MTQRIRLKRDHRVSNSRSPAGMAAATLAMLCLAGAASAQQATPNAHHVSSSKIDAITLSSGGLAEIRRSAQLHGDQALSMRVPLEQVNDILKSLIVRDPAGSIGSISLDGLSPVEETFRRLPFTSDELGSLPELAQSLQGVRIRASSGGRTVEGLILGVDHDSHEAQSPRQAEEEASALPVLSVMQDDGIIQTLPLGSDATLDIQDPAMRAKVLHAATVSGQGRNDEVRSIAIALTGTGDRDVGLSYVASAPIWKTAYRLIAGSDGKARLQAWAIIENATGEDWHDVRITLSSGRPVTLSQQLLKRYWHKRPEVPVLAQSAKPPRPDSETSVGVRTRVGGQMLAAHAPAPMMAPRALGKEAVQSEAALNTLAPSQAAHEAVAREGDTSASYMLPEMVTLAAGKTYAAPFIDTEVQTQKVSLFRVGQQGTHPVVALFLRNDTRASLPPGILTVYDRDEGYVGDAQLTGIPKGESRMVSFAGDAKVSVRGERKPQEEVSKITVADGVLKVTRVARLLTTYTVTGAADAPRTVIIEHPRREGWEFSSDALDSKTASSYRLKLDLKAGEQGHIEATQAQTRREVFALVDVTADTLMLWSGSAADPGTAKQLARMAELRTDMAQARAALQKVDDSLKLAARNQSRIRENLAAVPVQSELSQRYLIMLGQEEDRISALRKEANQAKVELGHATRALADYVKTIA